MSFLEVVGIDISKLTIDVACYKANQHACFDNNIKGFRNMLIWLNSLYPSSSSTLFCFENTGMYSVPLTEFLSLNQYPFSIISGLELKKSGGLEAERGKSDFKDSFRIARYGYLRRDELSLYSLPIKEITKLKNLITLRDRFVIQRAGLKSSIKEMKRIFNISEHRLYFKSQEKIKTELDKQINCIEKEMGMIIKQHSELHELYNLIHSVRGVGPILAINLIVITNAFLRFETSRKFASYSGIAPFKQQSGTSLHKKSRTSKYANQHIKKLLHMAAISTLKHDPEMRVYYKRRLEMGKSKMSTINIIRNKIVSPVFAVVKRKTAYVPLKTYAA